MFLLSRPTDADIESFLRKAESDSYSYLEVGATCDSPPAGYDVDHNRIMLGTSSGGFERAKDAIRRWTMFEVPGVELIRSDTPIEQGRTVALLAHHLGFYSLSLCRIVYVIEEENKFGFAYGTLTEHVEIGEERFSVEFDPNTGEVWYDILAFSRPGHVLVKLGYPYARYLQKRFAAGSKAAMAHAISAEQ